MLEPKRKERNAQKLTELYPAFAARVARVIAGMEAAGWRPRIQDAWRSPEDQLIAFNAGHSKLKYGFHNVTGQGGKTEALAVDLIDDDNPLNSRKPYLLQLAAIAEREGVVTGIRWGVPDELLAGIDKAIADQNWNAKVKIGWDPTHIQPVGITAQEAKAGQRPS
jgi:hypothetical protein